MKKRSLFIVVFLLIGCWVITIDAATVSFDSATYSVDADALASSPTIQGSENNTLWATSLGSGISETASVPSSTTATGTATSSIAANHDHSASGNVSVNWDNINQSTTRAFNWTDVTYDFTATSSSVPLHVSFDYTMSVGANAYESEHSSATDATALAEIYFDIYNAGWTNVYSFYRSVSAYAEIDTHESINNPTDSDSDSNTFDEIIYLTTTSGNQIHLNFWTNQELEAWIDGNANASLTLSNINVEMVPIPGAIWLLSSGLIGIVGIRRKFKKQTTEHF